jgi:Tfp pilus assembly protein PilN
MKGAIPINLASQPQRRDRPVYVATIAATATLFGLLIFQVMLAWYAREATIETRDAIARTSAQLRTLNAEQSRLDATMRQPKNAAALEESIFFNTLLKRKGISWTRIFSDLEEVTPHNVRLVSIRPQANQDNQIVLELVLASQTTEPVIEMLMKLESAPQFGATAVTSWLPPSQSEPLFRYRVNANYAPRL